MRPGFRIHLRHAQEKITLNSSVFKIHHTNATIFMNISILKRGLLFAAIAAGLATTGCQTTTTGPTRAAVGCDKCKTVWVATSVSGKFSGYGMSKRMVCPDCVSMVENYFKTGELKHTCPSCGSALQHCSTH